MKYVWLKITYIIGFSNSFFFHKWMGFYYMSTTQVNLFKLEFRYYTQTVSKRVRVNPNVKVNPNIDKVPYIVLSNDTQKWKYLFSKFPF